VRSFLDFDVPGLSQIVPVSVVSFAAPMERQVWERNAAYMLSGTYEVDMNSKELSAGSTATLPVRMKQTQLGARPSPMPIPLGEIHHNNANNLTAGRQCSASPSVLWNPLSQEESQKFLLHLQFQQQVQQQMIQGNHNSQPVWQQGVQMQNVVANRLPVIPDQHYSDGQLPNPSLQKSESSSAIDLSQLPPPMENHNQVVLNGQVQSSLIAPLTAETTFIIPPPPMTLITHDNNEACDAQKL
jgi:hypothetical protein